MMEMKLLLLGFPGTGKSTLVKKMNEGKDQNDRIAVDFDYKAPRIDNVGLSTVHAELVKEWFKVDQIKLLASFLPWINPDALSVDTVIYSVTPSLETWDEHLRVINERDKDGDQGWLRAVNAEGKKWVESWQKKEELWKKRFPNFKALRLAPGQFISEMDEFKHLV